MDSNSGFILVALAIVQVVLTLISLATNYWIVYTPATDSTDPVSSGLWAFCRLNGCVSYTEFDSTPLIKAVRAFVFLSWLYGLLGALLAGRMTFGKPDSKFFLRAVFVEIAIFQFVAMVVFSAGFSHQVALVNVGWGYSYIIGWISFIVALPGAVLSIWFTKSTKQVDSKA